MPAGTVRAGGVVADLLGGLLQVVVGGTTPDRPPATGDRSHPNGLTYDRLHPYDRVATRGIRGREKQAWRQLAVLPARVRRT
jgi:hypothetical protein